MLRDALHDHVYVFCINFYIIKVNDSIVTRPRTKVESSSLVRPKFSVAEVGPGVINNLDPHSRMIPSHFVM